MDEIQIRNLYTIEEFSQCIALQQNIWGDDDRELVPQHIFVVAAKTGGQVFGAFDGDTMVGYLLAFAGIRGNKMYLHSHMAGVLPAAQNRGVGKMLKLVQRDEALSRGIDLIEWTFDPLKLRNAYFNIVKLGAIVRTYLPNVYGFTSSHFDAGKPTDRFVAEWHLASERVQQILSGVHCQAAPDCLRVFVPAENQTIDVQEQLRTELTALFADGFALTNVERTHAGAHYCLEKYSTA